VVLANFHFPKISDGRKQEALITKRQRHIFLNHIVTLEYIK
jgi:hypothetical protein